jgi:hypothetical protein
LLYTRTKCIVTQGSCCRNFKEEILEKYVIEDVEVGFQCRSSKSQLHRLINKFTTGSSLKKLEALLRVLSGQTLEDILMRSEVHENN